MLNKIKLCNQSLTDTALTFDVQPINIFVGSNNSGKFLFLQELYLYLNHGRIAENRFKIIDQIQVQPYNDEESNSFLKKNTYLDTSDFDTSNYISFNPEFKHIQRVSEDKVKEALKNPEDLSQDELNNYRFEFIEGPQTLLINGQNRLNSFDSMPWSVSRTPGNSRDYKEHIIDLLRENPENNERFKSIIQDAFNKYIGVMYDGGYAQFVLSDIPIPLEYDMSLSVEATQFYNNCDKGINVSDGIKAYTGIVSKIISAEASNILIDEPEAFLHPHLARKLGKVIANLSVDEKKEIYISTHSADFIMGCIESNTPINIIRVGYDNRIATANLIDSSTLTELMRNPLFRSVNVIDGLFYKNVIVTEADSDRAFYQEINTRLKDYKPEWHIDDCLFLNAQNKQTVGPIVKLLRSVGVPAVSLIDFDLIKDGGSVFFKYLSSVNIPESLLHSIADKKTRIKDGFPKPENGKYPSNSEIKTKGIHYLEENSPQDLYLTAISMINDINQYGLFPVPYGELESWLPEIEADTHGNGWLIKKFESMGNNPQLSSYVKPYDGDVWLFMKNIKSWLDDVDRKGMV
uniref:ATP-dependent nuclease n=1 Tax=Carnobacterium sp. TaxID=48221 RepID=UPI00344E8B56